MARTAELMLLTALAASLGQLNAEPPDGEAPLPAGAVLRLGTTKLRCEGAIGFSPDGRLLVTGGVVMDAADGRRLASVAARCHPAWVAPDGRTVTGVVYIEPEKLPFREEDYRWVLRTVEIGTGKTVRDVPLPKDNQRGHYYCAAYSPDGKLVALLPEHNDGPEVQVKRAVTVCETATGRIHRRLEAAIGRYARLVAFSPDGRFVAAAGREPKKKGEFGLGEAVVHVWDVDTAQVRCRLNPLPNTFKPRKAPDGRPIGWTHRMNDSCAFLKFSPDSQSIIVGSGSSQLAWWSVATGKSIRKLDVGDRPLFDVSIDGTLLAVGPRREDHPRRQPAREIRILSAASGDIVRTLATSDVMWGAEFSPDGKRLAAVTQGRVIQIMDAATGLELGLKAGHQAMVTEVAFAPDGKTVATAARDNTVRLWDAMTGRQVLQLPGPKGGAGFLGYSGDGTTLVVVGQSVQIRSAATGELQREFPLDKDQGPSIMSRDARLLALFWMEPVGIGPDSKTFPRLSVWDLVAGRRLHRLAGLKGRPWQMTFSADGTLLVVNDLFTVDEVDGNATKVGDTQSRLVTWDMRSGSVVADHNLGIWVGVHGLSPDGMLAAGTAITGVIIWNTQTGRPVYRLPIGINPLGDGVSARFLSVGTMLFVDDTIWNWKTGKREQLVRTMVGHDHWWAGAVASSDGNRFATIDGSTVLVWDLAKLRAGGDGQGESR